MYIHTYTYINSDTQVYERYQQLEVLTFPHHKIMRET